MVYTLWQGGCPMPWKVINQMNLKIQFIKDWKSGYSSVTDLSQRYGISRPTVYKWLERYNQAGIEGLHEQSRAPQRRPGKTSDRILKLVIEEKLRNRKRGPRKVRAQLKRKNPNLKLPAISTIGYWFKKEGLVKKRKKRLHVSPYTQPFEDCSASNDTWSIDYKGQFYTRDKRICYPLTISDNHSRYLLGCKALPGPRHDPTREYLEYIFREHGLPCAIRSDNGVPFASTAIGGLSRLMIWLILLGITPERIKKGCPQQNGRHERMHRSLKYDVLDTVAQDLKEQQERFDVYRYEFNNERPHEALNDQTPSDYYTKSFRPYVEYPHSPEYESGCIVRQVRQNGEIKFKGRMFYVTESLSGLPVGLKEIADGLWKIQFSFYTLGSVDLKKNKIIRT